MSVIAFVFMLIIAALAAGAAVLVNGPWSTRPFIAWFIFGALLLVLPALLPLFIHP